MFDVTMGSVTPLWDFHTGVVPAREQLDEALKGTVPTGGTTQVDRQAGTARLADPEARIDLGGHRQRLHRRRAGPVPGRRRVRLRLREPGRQRAHRGLAARRDPLAHRRARPEEPRGAARRRPGVDGKVGGEPQRPVRAQLHQGRRVSTTTFSAPRTACPSRPTWAAPRSSLSTRSLDGDWLLHHAVRPGGQGGPGVRRGSPAARGTSSSSTPTTTSSCRAACATRCAWSSPGRSATCGRACGRRAYRRSSTTRGRCFWSSA